MDSIVDLYRRSAEAFRKRFAGDPIASEFLFSSCAAHLRSALEVLKTKDLVFLELGCGVGLNPVIAKEFGLASSYGVDINPRLIEEAKRNLALARARGLLSNGGQPVYKLGNFFTRGQLETIRGELDGREHKHLVLANPYPGSDVYEQLGVGFDEVDIFYMYPWYGKDFDYFRRFFNEQAKKGALLLLRNGKLIKKS